MPKLYSLKKKRKVTPQIGDLVQLNVRHSKKCKDETGDILNCMHAVIASVAGPWVTIKHFNGLVGFPFKEETAIPIDGCVQVIAHGWAEKQGDTWQRVE